MIADHEDHGVAEGVLFHPLTQQVWDIIKPKSQLPNNKRSIAELDDFLSFYHETATDPQNVGTLAALWLRVYWLGQCGQCGLNVWTEDEKEVHKIGRDPCPRCDDVVIPF